MTITRNELENVLAARAELASNSFAAHSVTDSVDSDGDYGAFLMEDLMAVYSALFAAEFHGIELTNAERLLKFATWKAIKADDFFASEIEAIEQDVKDGLR